MKKLILFCTALLALNFSSTFFSLNLVQAENEFYYTDKIEHLFTHCLIAYPEIAFKKGNTMASSYNTDCITPSEFKGILKQLHKNGYALVDINKCYKIENGKALKNKIKVQKGKKPLIFSFDDVNYDSKKMHKGMVDKLVLGKNGRIAALTKINGKDEVRYDNEFVPILESFIAENPDFSLDGARGTINLTGYDGILGYRTQSGNNISRKEEILKAKKVVGALKKSGWNFASHSYGHYHMKKISVEKFREEAQKWNDEVASIVGKTDIYVYPYGEWELSATNGSMSEKHKILEEFGFKLFCGVGMQPFYSYLPYKSAEKTLFMDRRPIDGFSLKNRTADLRPLFDTNLIYDYASRKV